MSHRSLALSVLCVALALLAGAEPARAAAGVFANFYPGTGANQGELLDGPGVWALDVYVEIGAIDSGNACRTGSIGDEICAYHVGIQIDGGGFITNFAGDSAAVKSWPQSFGSSVRNLTVAFAGANPQPFAAGPVHIGTLTVNAPTAGGTRVLVTGHQVVDAGLQGRIVPSDTLATLPEPGSIAQLVSGALALALLHRLRRGHAR